MAGWMDIDIVPELPCRGILIRAHGYLCSTCNMHLAEDGSRQTALSLLQMMQYLCDTNEILVLSFIYIHIQYKYTQTHPYGN